MKFKCDNSVLMSGINKVKQAADSRSNIPAFTGILIEACVDELRFTATDLELAIQYIAKGVNVEEPGIVLVPAKILSNVIRGLSGELILKRKNDKLLIQFGESVIRLNILDDTEFPVMPKNIVGERMEIGSDVIKTALSKTMFAMSTNVERPAFNGTLLKIKNRKIDFVTTDAHRMAIYSNDVEADLDTEAIVPRKTIKELFRAIGKDESSIQMIISESHILFKFGDTTILSRRIITQFPSYRAVIPENPTAMVTVNKANLVSSIKRASLFKNANYQIFGIQGKDKLTITAAMELFGSLEEKLTAQYEGQEEINIHLCIEFMLQALSVMSGNDLTLNYFGPFAPITIKEENYIQIVLPVRVG